VIDEIAPDVGDSFDVIAALLHAGIAAVPAEADEEDTAFDANTDFLEITAGEIHRRARTDRIVEHDGGLVPVDRTLYELERAMFLALRANQQTVVAAAGLRDAGIEDRDRGQADRGDLPAFESFDSSRTQRPASSAPLAVSVTCSELSIHFAEVPSRDRIGWVGER